MLLDIGRKLLCRVTLPPPLAVLATVVELATVACVVAEALTIDKEEDKL